MHLAWPESSRLLTADPFRLMQELWRDPFASFGQLDRWFGDFSPSVFQPRVDVVDDGDALCITAELPGMDREDVEILVEDDVLVLRGEKKLESKSEEEGCYRLERAFGSFQRTIPLPDGVDVDRAAASFEGRVDHTYPKDCGGKTQRAAARGQMSVARLAPWAGYPLPCG